MSFILDALRKSENERQQQAPAGLSTVPGSRDEPRVPRWLWLLAGLLCVNVAVVAALLLRTASEPPAKPGVHVEPASASLATGSTVDERVAGLPAPQSSFADQLEQARLNRPAGTATEQPATATLSAERGNNVVSPMRSPGGAEPVASGIATLPSLDEVRLSGKLALPEMHIDLHVYSATPERRFVSINGKKYRQKDRLTDGPAVREITPDGVILDYQGTVFALIK